MGTVTPAAVLHSFGSVSSGFTLSFASVTVHAVPEPPTIILLTLGVIGMGIYARRRIKRKRDS